MLPRRALRSSIARCRETVAPRSSTVNILRQQYESKVETPLQSQNKDSIAPSSSVLPKAEAPSVLETPLQKQRREALAPAAGGQTQRAKSWAVPTLAVGLIAIPPVVYYYYQYRREHMDNKRAALMEQQRQKYANGG